MLIKYSFWYPERELICTEIAQFIGFWYDYDSGLANLVLAGGMTTILYRMTPLEYNSLLGNLYRGISSGYYTITQLGLEEDDDVSDDEMNILFDNIRFKSLSQP